MSHRFTAADRLRKRAEFTRVQQQGRRVAGRFVTLLILANDCTAPRLGLIASRKLGPAVVRNRAKRRLREAARAVIPLHGRPGWDYVLVGRPATTVERPFASLCADLASALRALHGEAA